MEAIPQVAIFLFGLLQYGNLVLGQRKIVVFDSFFVAAILSRLNGFGYIALATVLFGLVILMLESKSAKAPIPS